MKDKLKILFGFLRGLRSKIVQTRVELDRSDIDYWDRKFLTDGNINIEIPSFIETILEELIDHFYYEFRKYIELDNDDYWFLYIEIYPNENKLYFQGQHKVEKSESFSRKFQYVGMKREVQYGIDYLYSEYPDTAYFDFEINGRFGEGDSFDFEVDNRRKKITEELDQRLWDIGYGLMVTITGDRYWNEGPGAELSCRIWGDDIIVKGNIKKEEYEDSGMNLEITLDNIEDFK